MNGRMHVVRGSLGTQNEDVARRLKHKLETAISEGPLSLLWQELQILLPGVTYKRFAKYFGVKQLLSPTWMT